MRNQPRLVPAPSTASTSKSATPPRSHHGASGRSAYVAISVPNHNIIYALTDDVERLTVYTLSQYVLNSADPPIRLESSPRPAYSLSIDTTPGNVPCLVILMASVAQTPQEFVSANITIGAS